MDGNVGGIKPILCRSLEGLLHRDRSFARAFVGDRRTFERIVKSTIVAGGDLLSSRMERSAGLHCIVLAFRLARIDDFTSEISLPVLIAGALSGVVQYPASRQVQQQQEQHGGEKRHTQNAAMPSPVTKQYGNNDGQQAEEASWPSTQLFSAQELASHALVHPMVRSYSGQCYWPCVDVRPEFVRHSSLIDTTSSGVDFPLDGVVVALRLSMNTAGWLAGFSFGSNYWNHRQMHLLSCMLEAKPKGRKTKSSKEDGKHHPFSELNRASAKRVPQDTRLSPSKIPSSLSP